MEIERADPDRIEVLGGKPGDKERYIESDFRIRSGLCPNGHGLMTMGGWGQECPTCGFTCNTMPDTPNGADAQRRNNRLRAFAESGLIDGLAVRPMKARFYGDSRCAN